MEIVDRKLESAFKIGETVDLDFMNSKYIKGVIVSGIRFTESKVYYDILVPVGFDTEFTILENIDSILVVRQPN